MITLLKGRHVYTVLEFAKQPIIHGVFAKREYAENQAKKLKSRHKRKGYIAVLKKRLHGGI